LEASFLPLELMFEHRNYLPSAFLLLAVAGVLDALPAPGPRTRAGAVVAATAVLAVLTAARAQVWGSEPALYQHIHRLHPRSAFAAAMMAELLSGNGYHERALALLDERPGAGPAVQRLLIECRARGAIDGAAVERAAGSIDGPVSAYLAEGVIGLGAAVLDGRCRAPEAAVLRLLETASERPVAQLTAAYRLGVYRAFFLNRAGRVSSAAGALERVQRLRPADPMPLLLATEMLLDDGQHLQARRVYHRARALGAQAGEVDRARLRELAGRLGE